MSNSELSMENLQSKNKEELINIINDLKLKTNITFTFNDLIKQDKNKLVELCKERGLSYSGKNKKVLSEIIMDHVNGVVKEKKKRPAPAHSELQIKILKKIVVKDKIIYSEAMKKLKYYMEQAIGKPYEKNGDLSYVDTLKKVDDYLDKH